MKYFSCLLVSIIFFSCADYSTDEVKAALINHDYWLINAQNDDTTNITFYETCSKHYSWEKFIVDEWEVSLKDNHLILDFDTHDYIPKQLGDGDFEFNCTQTGERLVKAMEPEFDKNKILGKWYLEQYAQGIPNDANPCPGQPETSIHIPGIDFKEGNCTILNLCDSREEPYLVKQLFKMIIFGDPCSSKEAWRIKLLENNLLVVDRQYEAEGKLNYELNKRFVRATN
ncbi:MAG: hypothetical protein GC192_18245 [Bacteroidetes bacterium]|nr:hypothetical protein [Bacteroidota bacterium]